MIDDDIGEAIAERLHKYSLERLSHWFSKEFLAVVMMHEEGLKYVVDRTIEIFTELPDAEKYKNELNERYPDKKFGVKRITMIEMP